MEFLETPEGILIFSVIGLAIFCWVMYKIIEAGSYGKEIYKEQLKQTKLLAGIANRAGMNEESISEILEFGMDEINLPIELENIKFNPVTQRFFITENGLTYHMTFEHTRILKEYFRANHSKNPTIEEWYNSLYEITRNEIIVKGSGV